ncbi:MAG: hemerythrin domain-containing protein [Bacteroidales bacterium]|nr:hemerythrin domain-containing protein [Bacteroidales bacterium]
MSDLITILVEEHNSLKLLLSEVYDYISSEKKKIEFVKKLKTILVAHIDKEDKELYPFLNKEAETDESLKRKLASFAKDWKEISIFANNYFERYCENNFDANFTADTAKLLSTLRQRMIKEEVSLFSEYRKRM